MSDNQNNLSGEIVNISCRATDMCQGKQAEIVNKDRDAGDILNPGELHVRKVTYKCLTCGKLFTITF
jgi:hypothetical protein